MEKRWIGNLQKVPNRWKSLFGAFQMLQIWDDWDNISTLLGMIGMIEMTKFFVWDELKVATKRIQCSLYLSSFLEISA